MAYSNNYKTESDSKLSEALPQLIKKFKDNPDITLSELLQETDTDTEDAFDSEDTDTEDAFDSEDTDTEDSSASDNNPYSRIIDLLHMTPVKTPRTTDKPEKKAELILNGKTIHSLEELRENYDPDSLLEAFKNETLKKWLEERIKLISTYTDNEDIFANPYLAALNQEELAGLIDDGESLIYLCNGSFSVPISVSGIRYVCIAGAVINNPYTKDQYEKAGIQIEGITLPDTVDEEKNRAAYHAAVENGYDDFHEHHTSLASIFHERLKSEKLWNVYVFPYIDSTADKYFKTKKECKEFRNRIIKKYYKKAEEYITPGNSKALSVVAADRYSRNIKESFSPYIRMLEMISHSAGADEAFNIIKSLVDNSYENLYKDFEDELDHGRDYYEMYDFDYFVDMTEIEEHDYRIETDMFTRALETLFADSIEYSVPDLYDAIAEIEEDLESHADLFFGTAYRMYQSYVEQIEKMLDIIGRNQPAIKDEESVDDYIARLVAVDEVKC